MTLEEAKKIIELLALNYDRQREYLEELNKLFPEFIWEPYSVWGIQVRERDNG